MASGDKLQNHQIAERVQTAIMSSDATAGTYATETSILTATAALTSGRKYAIRAYVRASSTATSSVLYRVREDTVSGAQNSINRIIMDTDSAGVGCELYGEYTATATASKTFALCIVLRSGSGTITPRSPSYLLIDELPV